jgi:phenylalanyl-tRNA synthetase beta chain
MAVMRTTLAGGLLTAVSHNLNRKNTNNRFFEIGKTFTSAKKDSLPVECECVGIIIEGCAEPPRWNDKGSPVDFYSLKSVVESVMRHSGAGKPECKGPGCKAAYLCTESADLIFDNGMTGVIGRLKNDVCALFDISTPVYYAEIDFTNLLTAKIQTPSYSPLPRYPAVERDFCFVMSEKIQSEELVKAMRSVSDIIERVEPFDVYRGEKLGAGLKSIAYSVCLRAADKTLTDNDADAVGKKIISAIKENFNAELRAA